MLNIELFNLSVAEVMGVCYESFPERIHIRSITISDKVSGYYPEESNDEENNIVWQIFPIATATIQWLEQAGYLWVGNQEQDDFLGVTLTPKGLELLNMIPDSLSQKEPVGSLLLGGLKTSAKETALTIMKTVLAEGVKMSLKGGS